MESQKLITVSGIFVMVIWAFTVVSAVFTNHYEPMQITTPVMVIYAGFVFARNIFGKQDSKSSPSKEKSNES